MTDKKRQKYEEDKLVDRWTPLIVRAIPGAMLLIAFSRSYVYAIGVVFLIGGIISFWNIKSPKTVLLQIEEHGAKKKRTKIAQEIILRITRIIIGIIGVCIGIVILVLAVHYNSTYKYPFPI